MVHAPHSQRVVPCCQAAGGCAGGAQQGMGLGIGEACRLPVADGAHRPNVARRVSAERSGSSRPPAQSAQSIQPAVYRGRPTPAGDHVLAVSDQLVFGQTFDSERPVLDRVMPGKKMAQVVAVATQCECGAWTMTG